MVAKLIRLGYLTEIDHANVPNITNLRADLQQGQLRPGPQVLADLAVRTGRDRGQPERPPAAGRSTSIDQLLTDPTLRGKVTLLTEMRDTVGLTMLDMGYNIEDFTERQFDKAIAKLQAAVNSGQIRRFTGNDYGADLVQGNVAACIAWTGDVVSACRPTLPICSTSSRTPAARCGATTSSCRSAARTRRTPSC